MATNGVISELFLFLLWEETHESAKRNYTDMGRLEDRVGDETVWLLSYFHPDDFLFVLFANSRHSKPIQTTVFCVLSLEK